MNEDQHDRNTEPRHWNAVAQRHTKGCRLKEPAAKRIEKQRREGEIQRTQVDIRKTLS